MADPSERFWKKVRKNGAINGIAAKFGVTYRNIIQIVRRASWRLS